MKIKDIAVLDSLNVHNFSSDVYKPMFEVGLLL